MPAIRLIGIDDGLRRIVEEQSEDFDAVYGASLGGCDGVVREVVSQTLALLDRAPRGPEWGGFLVADRAFGFTRRLVVPGPDDRVEHSELSLGSAVIMVSSPKPERGRVGPRGLPGASHALCVHVGDPDAHHSRARAEGAEIVQDLRDEEYGSRGYMAQDLEGNLWYFGTYRPGAWWDDDPSSGSTA
jgi:uncharacterized glyoxalase superfamily protein PhnB